MIKNKKKDNAWYQKKTPLVEYKTVTNIKLLLRGSRVPSVFTESAAPEVERNNIK